MSNTVPIPAAQYLRMSTENQQYSLTNQSAAILAYARQNGFVVVRTYTDAGRSGLRVRNRPGLTALLQDVIQGEAGYRAILVYDVSRWGRFQDTDESAHYEFLCRSNGIPIHYCAEQFANDMALPSLIVKSLKRSMAAEYSRELSVRVYAALRRAAEEGFHVGSTPGYGFRRMLFGADGLPKQVLRDGEEKNLRSERVKLVLGPPEEIRVVRLIYHLLLHQRLRPTEIMRELFRRHIMFHAKPWSFYAVKHVLTDPKYCGLLVWGRTESKLKGSVTKLPKEIWIASRQHGPRIVTEGMFGRAQVVYRDRTDQKSNDQLLDVLRSLWQANGYLTQNIVENSPLTPSVDTYRRRFGRLSRAFALIGYKRPTALCNRKRMQSRRISFKLRRMLVRRLCRMFPALVTESHYNGCVHCPDVGADVVVSVCRACPTNGHRLWFATPRREQEHAIALLCLLNDSNDGFDAFYIFPRFQAGHWQRIYENSTILNGGRKLCSLSEFYRAVVDTHTRIPEAEKARQPKALFGVPQIAEYLKVSEGIVRRLIRQGMPILDRGRRLKAVPEEVSRWVHQNGTVWIPKRDRLGRYLRTAPM